MHKVMAKSLLSPGNGMNLYRGCTHGCIYCDSRSKCYGMDHPFEDIEVKENALQLLERALKAKRKPCMIGTGSMSDPYIHQEMELNLMGRSLELIEKYGFGVAVQTKSDRILRDLELYRRINEKTKAVVQMTLTTEDDELCRILEPNVAVTSRRVAVLKAFREAGVPTVVWLCPVLPFLTDTEENIRAIVELCADAGVMGIVNFGMGLTLRDGNREYFYSCLDKNFPGLKERYIRKYGNAYEITSPHQKHLLEVFHKTCEEKGICHENQRIFAYLREFEEKRQPQQLSFL